MSGMAPEKVLVVDDEPEILIALEDLLEEDHVVLAAHSPAEALELLRSDPHIAVIISDQRMPGMNGDAFLAEARRVSAAEALLLTGYADLEAVVRAINNGRIAGYSPKPWDPAALRGMVAGARERYRLARALETEQRLLRGLLEHSQDALSFKDRDGRFIRLNAVKAASLGVDVAACLGRREEEFLAADGAAALAAADEAARREGQPGVTSIERGGDGPESRHFEVSRIPIPGRDGRIEWLATIEREVTEARRLEARLRQADKMQALGTLAGGVAHDFNNLLTAIIGSLRIATQPGIDPARSARLLGVALAAAERGASLTQRLLSFSRQRSLMLRPTSINQLLAGMGDLLARSLGGGVQLEQQLDPDLWPAKIDPDQLELVVLNLCVNARDAMGGGGTVVIATRNLRIAAGEDPELPAGDYVVVSVRDTGSGIPPEVLSRVFEPFFTTKEVGSGTGLGLSMAHGMAQQSGGAIRIASRLGEGTTVELTLPRSSPADAPAPEAESGTVPHADHPVRILVADDEADVREVTSAILREMGHETIEAGDADSALRLLASEPVELLITDFAMPRVSGVELAHHARGLRPSVPVLLMTGYADLDKVPRDLPVIRKPFQPAELARLVAELCAPA
ncbi:response regulator [Belnapia sp. T6]|uniref:histidine kinase n=1 Tax=Belnapia mucosa TaxID=2804532 RepID=A0ABS1V1Y5_9PROT|nr:response regulator [Belnapia mucosa]MBL6455714.1 response regulator [Belnapia mucosa]